MNNPLADIRALFFDVFGTVVDWRTGVAREARALLEPKAYRLDWLAFADAWRAEYQPAMEEVRSGRLSFCRLDILHRRNLERILPRFGVAGLTEADLAELTLAWHRLDPWPDAVPGLARLKQRYIVAPVSNGNIALIVNMAKRGGLPWDVVLGAEIAGDYKPNARVYRASAEALSLSPAQCMMVAAHSDDLKAAALAGLRTAHVARPDERGPGRGESQPDGAFDLAVRSFVELADRLDA